MPIFIYRPECPTCQEAKALLNSNDATYDTRNIEEESPTYDELKEWLALSDLPVTSFFDADSPSYMSMGLKDKLSAMSEDECLRLLATDGQLLNCPLLVCEDGLLVGFNHDEWESALADMPPFPNMITVEMTDSNDINFPFEWHTFDRFGQYAQITFIDDRIAIHKPLAADIEYTKPCKAGDNSYIRASSLFSIRVPKQFFVALGIKSGDKIDLSLEENCISIRKNIEVTPDISAPDPEPEPPEPIMAFCCVCGSLRYTDGSLVKVADKYICPDCIEIVKAL